MLNSDHLPIAVNFEDDDGICNLPRTRRSFTNFALADWGEFQVESEAEFARLLRRHRPTSCAAGEKAFRRVFLNASKRHIPSGFHKLFRPGLSREARDLMRECNDRHAHDLADPVIRELNARISAVNDENARQAWVKELSKSDHKTI